MSDKLTCGLCGSERVQDNHHGRPDPCSVICTDCHAFRWGNGEWQIKEENDNTLAQGQLHNAIVLLEKGYGIYEEVEPLLEKYGDVENVPERV